MDIQIADSATVDESVVFGANCGQITIGHGSRIHRDVYIDVAHLVIGDYVTIHHGTVIHGESVQVGHNCWIGHYCILDGLGGVLKIGNNVGIGAQSQLWSHMKFGDVLAGCKWNESQSLIIEDDVWFVGHTIVTPIVARAKSMLMVGGVAVRDMEENRTYGGSPAKDLTDVFGPQFSARSVEERLQGFDQLIHAFRAEGGNADFVRVKIEIPPEQEANETTFDPIGRQYMPRYTEEETTFMRFLLYERAKFLPVSPTSK